MQVGQLREVSNKTNNAELKLFLEVDLGLVPLNFLGLLSFIDKCFFALDSTVLYLLTRGIFQDLVPSPPPDKSKDDILLFFKLYDPEKEELQ